MNEQAGNPPNPNPEGASQDANLPDYTQGFDSPIVPSQGESATPAFTESYTEAYPTPVQEQVPVDEQSFATDAPLPPPTQGTEVPPVVGQPVSPYGQ